MNAPVSVVEFILGAGVSLGASAVVVRRIERVGAHLDISDAALGVVAALAADAPEITSAFSAVAEHQQAVGAGVVLGSNVFNLAALLGLGALVAGGILLHRRVVALAGTLALWVGAACLLAVTGVMGPVPALVMGLAGLGAYLVVLTVPTAGLLRLGLPPSWVAWLRSAAVEEGLEVAEGSDDQPLSAPVAPARRRDVLVGAVGLVVVVAASVVMERAGSSLGRRWDVPEIVVGGVVLAAVTSLPNAVSAVYLAHRGRATASFATALNSNNLNVVVGLLVPGSLLGLGARSGQTTFVAAWYVGLTVVALAWCYRDGGVRRAAAMVLVAGFAVFVAVLVVSGPRPAASPAVLASASGVTAVLAAAPLARRRRR